MRRLAPLLAASLLTAATGCDALRPAAARAGVVHEATAAPQPSLSLSAARTPSPAPAPVVVPRGDGRLVVVPGRSAPAGTGPRTTYLVEVEGGLGLDTAAFVAAVEATLADPRSWTAGGRRSLQRVDVGPVDVRVALSSPRTTDRLCAPLRTAGRFSCANGDRAVVNAARWLTGTAAYDGHLAEYRAYVVNHEVGHVLGLGHARCPGPGRPAPVMQQQTKGLDGCARNAWPHP